MGVCACLKHSTFEGGFACELSVGPGMEGGVGDEVKCSFLHAHSEQEEEGSGGGLFPGMNRRQSECVCVGVGVGEGG